MGKIGIIIQREYWTRVKNKTFIIMCFVAPILFAALMIIPPLLAGQPGETRRILVVDNSNCPDSIGYAYIFQDTANLIFDHSQVFQPIDKVEKMYRDSDDVSILYIPDNFMGGCDTLAEHSPSLSVILKSKHEPGFNTLNLIQAVMTQSVQEDIMRMNGISQDVMEQTRRKVTVLNQIRGKIGKSEIKAVTGLVFGLVIYMYILMFGVAVMKSVVEEKTTRIVEVIVSSVRPFQLMLGKIIGVALVGLTQFLIWMLLSFLIVTPVINAVNEKKVDFTQLQQPGQVTQAIPVDQGAGKIFNMEITEETQVTVETILSIPWSNLLPAFLFYFIFGYLMYASLFASLGSAADTDADTQQFSFPVTIPLVIGMMASSSVLNDPDGPIARWLSMIPFTSPIVMLMRIPYGGVYVSELILSMLILVISFLIMTWISGKIYRVGILMYGKKVTWKELFRWMFYKG